MTVAESAAAAVAAAAPASAQPSTPTVDAKNGAAATAAGSKTPGDGNDAAAAADADDDAVEGLGDMFADPANFYPPSPPQAKHASFTLADGRGPTLSLRLVGHSALEGHYLWNGAQAVTRFIEQRAAAVDRGEENEAEEDDMARVRIQGANVIELGAAAGLPSLAAGWFGARRVVMTDWPDAGLVDNMRHNVDETAVAFAREKTRGAEWALDAESGEEEKEARRDQSSGEGEDDAAAADFKNRVCVRGYIWGRDVAPLLSLIQDPLPPAPSPSDEPYYNFRTPLSPAPAAGEKFDVIIMADLLFRHCEHANLVLTIRALLRRARHACALVFFTSYRPHFLAADLAFFGLARDAGLRVARVRDDAKMDVPLFGKKDEHGNELVTEMVGGWAVGWAEADWE
jgi:nicotinamide N-methyltransferase